MSKIHEFTAAVNALLTDLFIVDRQENNEWVNKKVTLQQIGETVNGEQTYSDLISADKTIVGAINEIGSLPDTSSGSIATFTTSLEKPLVNCECEIVASGGGGTPTSPISIVGYNSLSLAVRGVEVWDNEWELGSIDESTGEKTVLSTAIRSKNMIRVTPNTAYYFYIGVDISNKPYFYDVNGNYIGRYGSYIKNQTFTTPANAFFMMFAIPTTYGTTYNNDISINYPSTDTTYHAYNTASTTYPITWQDEAGTIYGGSLNVTSGVLTVTWGIKTFVGDSSESWFLHTTIANCFYINNALTNAYLNNTELNYAKSNMFVQDSYNRITALTNGQFCLGDITGTQRLACKNTDIATASDWKTWLSNNNLTIIYKLATPTTYQLTPTEVDTLVGTNNVFNDCNGDTSVTYLETIKEYIDKRVNP